MKTFALATILLLATAIITAYALWTRIWRQF